MSNELQLLQAVRFAAEKHKNQRRKNIEASPYINHPIQVAELIASVGKVTDPVILMGAILHDTVEDTETTIEELESLFGKEVSTLVAEVTDDKSLPKAERKRKQVEHAAVASTGAKTIKLADKSSNIWDIAHSPPHDWDDERRRQYLIWAGKVIDACRGANVHLEQHFDDVLANTARELGITL